MNMSSIKPYQNEEESLAIGELTVENRLDRVSVYGSIELTKDKAGLQQAKALKEVLDAVVAVLEREKTLLDHVQVKPTEKVKNPFE
jgi:hypothetical protein